VGYAAVIALPDTANYEKNGFVIIILAADYVWTAGFANCFAPKNAISRDREQVDRPFEMKNIFTTSSTKCRHCGSITENSSDTYVIGASINLQSMMK